MNYTGDLLLDGEDIPLTETHEQHSGMRSVQNLEAIINEGRRTNPLGCCWSIWERR